MSFDFLPLKSYANIVEGNALRIPWESVVSKNEVDFIMVICRLWAFTCKIVTKKQM